MKFILLRIIYLIGALLLAPVLVFEYTHYGFSRPREALLGTILFAWLVYYILPHQWRRKNPRE